MQDEELEALLSEACSRQLSEEEVSRMCLMAEAAGRSQSVLIRLITSGTSAGRLNLSAAGALTSRHSPKRHDRKEIRQVKADEVAARVTKDKSSNLPFGVSNHAFERYVQRHSPNEPVEVAVTWLILEAASASPIRDRTMSGDEQWVGQTGVVFVVRRDGNGSLPVCVTVIPKEEDKPAGRRPREGKPGKSRYR